LIVIWVLYFLALRFLSTTANTNTKYVELSLSTRIFKRTSKV